MHAIVRSVDELAPALPHDEDYLTAVGKDLTRWSDAGFDVPDFLDSLVAFHPQRQRVDGLPHLVLFPMYTQNGSTDRRVEAVLLQVRWPDVVAHLEAEQFSNALFVPVTFLDFTPGYDTNSAVLFPETVAVREVPTFTWGAIFADREAARFRRVVRAAADTTRLALPPDAARLLDDQRLAEETFVLWDLVHDRTHMRGDLPFDPFMIKQRMPFFLYSLEELRCDLTAFRAAVRLEGEGVPHARYVQYAILFDRLFRFPVTGTRVRNYDGLGGQLLFAWLHQHHVLHWTDSRLTIDWPQVPAAVIALAEQIEQLYWRSIDRPKTAHWLAAYALVSGSVTPHPASAWARARPAAGRPAQGVHRRRAGRRVPALDVLRGAVPQDRRRRGVDERHHRLSAAVPDIVGSGGTRSIPPPSTSEPGRAPPVDLVTAAHLVDLAPEGVVVPVARVAQDARQGLVDDVPVRRGVDELDVDALRDRRGARADVAPDVVGGVVDVAPQDRSDARVVVGDARRGTRR